MAFCIHCGQRLAEGAQFCANCGNTVNRGNSSTQRKTVYDGEIHKCPQCGEVLSSFVTNCPSCGYELRGAKSSNSIQEFTSKLENAKTEEQRILLIRNFPIPNTKEDIFEFMFLASSNINDASNKQLFNAWSSKIQQCYDKAKILFKNDSDFIDIQSLYDNTFNKIRKAKRKGPLNKFLRIAVPIVVFIFLNIIFWSWVIAPDPKAEAEEVARLEAIVKEVDNALANNEYDLAMMHAKSIDYSAYKANDELERQWDIKRDYLIKKIISAAAKDGIVMDYPTDTADEKDKQKSNKENINNYNTANGFENGTYEITNIMNFTFEIPNYWVEKDSINEKLQYYAEHETNIANLSISFPKESDDNYSVSFDGLYSDNENMITAVGKMFTDGVVTDYNIFESNYGVKGILYTFSYTQEIDWFTKEKGSGYCFCFPSETDRRWFYITLTHTNNVTNNYKDDYMTLISSIKEILN